MQTEKELKEESSFWDHLEALRWTIFRSLGVLMLFAIISFSFKDFIFNKILLPPLSSDFHTYRVLCKIGELTGISGFCAESFKIELINIALAGQFMMHILTSMIVALIISVPYLLYEIWRFVRPALYPKEKKSVSLIFLSSSFLFYLGALVSYFIVFPFTLRFLGTYEISTTIINQVSIQSYMNTLFMLVLFMGLAFELPVIVFLLSQIGVVHKELLRNIRRYAFVGVLVLAAFITPTTDPFTMLLVAAPIYILYEVSIWVCKPKRKDEDEDENEED